MLGTATAVASLVEDGDYPAFGGYDMSGASAVAEDSCVGSCGKQAAQGCHCDAACEKYGDCCDDHADACVR